ncbi:hypothetical protein H2203_001887 [Taxawa tesnikishii (nom. ined.)]|nr:hypothetical protein H2203_001887 [Dothideales sp. JES 119]
MADTIEPKHVANITESPVGSVDEESYETTHAPTRDGPIATLRAEEWWKWEILGVLGSAAALIGIVIFLHKLNGHPQPQWSFKKCVDVPKTNYHFCTKKVGVSVNSVISWLSTVAKICVLIPITKGLGQLKWVWFTEKERMLSDLETFDSATRGLTGSAMLVWRLRGRQVFESIV